MTSSWFLIPHWTTMHGQPHIKSFYIYFCICCCRYMYALNNVSFYRSTFCSLACYSKHHQISLWLVMESQFLQCLFVYMNYAFLSFSCGSLFWNKTNSLLTGYTGTLKVNITAGCLGYRWYPTVAIIVLLPDKINIYWILT